MKHSLAITFTLLTFVGFSQTKDRIAIIDTDYIKKKMPEYIEGEKELQKRANEWNAVIDRKKKEIKDLKDQLNTERPLLTQQLIEEKQEDIAILERELLTYQQEKFGVNGDYFVQKINLSKPIQDQIFTVVHEIAEKKKYSMIIDKSTDDVSMIYTNERFDISDQVIRELEKTRSKAKMSKKEIAQMEAQEKQQEIQDRQRSKREELAERQKELERKKEDQIIEDYLSKNPNFDESPAEAQKRKMQEQADAIKRKQEELRKLQEEKIAEQKRKIEEQRLAIEKAKEKARQEAEKKRQELLEQQKAAQKRQQELKEEQAKKLEEQKRQQLLKKIELEKKQAEKLAERQKIIEQKKQEMERVKAERIKQQQEQRQKLKEEADKKQEELRKQRESK